MATQPTGGSNQAVPQSQVTQVATSAVAPTAAEKATAARANAQAELDKVQLPFQQRLANALEKYVQVTKCPDHYNFKFVAACLKCGWSSHQMTEADAKQILRQHVQCHWRDVSAGL